MIAGNWIVYVCDLTISKIINDIKMYVYIICNVKIVSKMFDLIGYTYFSIQYNT